MILARAFLWTVAAVFIGFGLWGLLEPHGMVAEFGVTLSGPDGATMIRASYGGFLIGEGLLLAWCGLAHERVRFGLVAVAILTAPILLSRLLGMVIDGSSSPYHQAYAVIEIIGVSLALIFLRRADPA